MQALKWLRRSKQPSQVKVSTTDANAAVATAAETPLPPDQPANKPPPTDILADSKPSDDSTSTPNSPAPDNARPRDDSVISETDERYLERIVSSAEEPRLPPYDDASDGEEPSLAEAAAAEVAKKTPLPQSPPPSADKATKKANRYSWAAATETLSRGLSFRRRDPGEQAPAKPIGKEPAVAGPATKEEDAKEKKDLANVLQRLKLDSNSMQARAMNLSEDSRNLVNQFIQILKDVVAGAPHAYDDLDDFFKHREKQIEGLYDNLPPFLQKLVQALPTKAWQYLGPQVAAGMAAATSGDKTRAQAEAQKRKRGNNYIPSLKSLLGNQGAVAAMLRSILEFLEARFPAALAGTNVLLSVAVFLLLFVFWYCYKRGRDERLVVEGEEATRGRSREGKDGVVNEEAGQEIEKSLEDEEAKDGVTDKQIEQEIEELVEGGGEKAEMKNVEPTAEKTS